jgi:hypothetical protein
MDELLALHYRREAHCAYRQLCQCKGLNRLISSVFSCTVHEGASLDFQKVNVTGK